MDQKEQEPNSKALRLFMVLVGGKPKGRTVEQHDYFFGIAFSVTELSEKIKSFWPELGKTIHVDGWRKIELVDDFEINIKLKDESTSDNGNKLFFINLGGYQQNILEEKHCNLLIVEKDMTAAIRKAKKTDFFKQNSITGGPSHVDDKFGFDVDDAYNVADLLNEKDKSFFSIDIKPTSTAEKDKIHLGYFRLDKL